MTSDESLEEFLIAKHFPAFARRVLLVGCDKQGLARRLRERGAAEIHAIESSPELAAESHPNFDSVLNSPASSESLPFPSGYFDCIALPNAAKDLDGLSAKLSDLVPFLTQTGYVFLEAPNKHYWRGNGSGTDPESMRRQLEPAGLVLYGVLRALDPESQIIQPDAQGNLVLGGVAHHMESEIDRLSLIVTNYVFVAVRADYDAITHAGAFFDAGHPDWAYTVLSMIPPPYLEDDDICANVFADMMLCQLAMDKSAANWQKRLERFSISQEAFYRAIARKPRLHLLYNCQAQFWHRLGNDDMAARILRSLLRVAPEETTETQLAQYRPARIHIQDTPPEWRPPARMPRILFITHPRPHYGLDIIYDGLCTALGTSNVTDFPWKPSLHGQPPKEMAHYPCMFNRPGRPLSLDQLLVRLMKGQYDAILYGDLEEGLERGMARRIMKAAENTPVFILDEQDDAKDSRRTMTEFLAIDSIAGFFKREMLDVADYGPRSYPLPFAYPERRVPSNVDSPRNTPLFWAGHRQFGLRRLYLEHLEATRNVPLDTVFDQADYVRALLDTRIGLNLFGCGFDTVRYWELPAHGCMLLSERLPIRIPHNFIDGKSAVFFDDTQDLERKLDYYLAHPEEADAIARAGHEHFTRYHTGSMRAKQMLAWMQLDQS